MLELFLPTTKRCLKSCEVRLVELQVTMGNYLSQSNKIHIATPAVVKL